MTSGVYIRSKPVWNKGVPITEETREKIRLALRNRKGNKLCIIRKCKKSTQTRGLCSKHYRLAFFDVLMDRTTWRELHSKRLAVVAKYKDKQDSQLSTDKALTKYDKGI